MSIHDNFYFYISLLSKRNITSNNTIWLVLSISTSESFPLFVLLDSLELGFFKFGNSFLTLLIPNNKKDE